VEYPEMIVDFHHHYTPPELMERGMGDGNIRLDENGNPDYRFNSLLADLSAHLQMMDLARIDVAVLSCGAGLDECDVSRCRLINDRLHQAERDYPGRFIGLAHVPALDPQEASAELKRCAVELGFPGVAIASEIRGRALDADELRPFWRAAADLELYVFIHPLPRVIRWAQMDADDLGRMLGWEFSLMVATVRLINSGLLDELPSLKIQISHFAGGIGRYLPRIQGFPQREGNRTVKIPRHDRYPRQPFDYYLQHRLFYDCCGWAGPDRAAERGAQWVAAGLTELPASQVVFATDYPQAVQDRGEVMAYTKAIRALGPGAQGVVDGINAEKLILNLNERLKASVTRCVAE
jgi:predicted TIM-barrel fold metal-dependent hydrolase